MKTRGKTSFLIGGLALLSMRTAVAAEQGVNALNYPGAAWSPYLVGAGIGVLSFAAHKAANPAGGSPAMVNDE